MVLQVGPLYLAEMAPAKLRGTLNVIFQLFVTIGILIAGLINYGSQYIKPWGWRLPLALAGAPGIFIFVAGLILPESPNSLAEREKYEQAAKVGLCCSIVDLCHTPCAFCLCGCESPFCQAGGATFEGTLKFACS